MSNEKNNLFSVMVEAAVKGSETMAYDFTSWKKPVARIFFYFGTFVFMLLAIPFVIPYKLYRKKSLIHMQRFGLNWKQNGEPNQAKSKKMNKPDFSVSLISKGKISY